jgi:2-dehydro-3-deoxygalactonokinase
MSWGQGFIAADWGTSNRRAYRVDAGGVCVDEFEDNKGILSVAKGEFPAAVAEIRSRLGDLPLLLAGMIGSNRGWIEASYVPCPAGLSDLAERLIWAEERRTAIVPGISYLTDSHADVMRGEEVQILGAVAAGTVPQDCLICHPGTHNKWINVLGGRIIGFRTVMTGEVFNLLKEHSILSDLISGEVAPDAAFSEGVRRGLANDGLTAELFSVRAKVLLGRARREDASSFVSGLLIGADIRVGQREAPEAELIVMGRPELTSLYAAALVEAGSKPLEMDGEQAFLMGAVELARLIR